MKKLFTPYSFLLLLFVCGAFSAHAQGGCVSGASWVQPITVTNQTSIPLTDYEMQLTINTQALVLAGNMQADGDDIRFTTSGCCGALAYFIESGMNTSSTVIWVRIPSIPGSGSTTIYMLYGNPNEVAASNASATFAFYEGFDSPAIQMTANCGGPTVNVAGGNLDLSWGSQGLLVSNNTFPLSEVYTAEADIVGASGNWPGVYWAQISDQRGYATLMGGSDVRVAVSGSSSGYCQGMNWASPVLPIGSPVGMWAITWVATGNIIGVFPGIGVINSSDATHPRAADLVLMLGGISSGSGSMTVNWLRARKYIDVVPVAAFQPVQPFNAPSVNIGNDQQICPGASATFTATGTFSTYAWSTGDNTASITVSAAGTYVVTVTDGTGCPAVDSADVILYAVTPPSLGPDTTTCSTPYMLVAGSYTSYDWSDGSTGSTLSVTQSGTYSVTVTDANGCTSSDQVVVTITGGSAPTITATGGQCVGDTVTLTASGGFTSYSWSTGDVTATTSVTANGTYTVTVTDGSGCTSTASQTVNLAPSPTAQFTPTTNLLSVLFLNQSTAGTTSFWDFGDGSTTTLNNPSHTYGADGTYNVCLTVTAPGGCQATTCQAITVSGVSIQDALPGTVFSIGPVPASSHLDVQITTEYPGPAQLSVIDLAGRTVLTQATELNGSDRVRMELKDLSAGTYMLRLQTTQGFATRKFTVE